MTESGPFLKSVQARGYRNLSFDSPFPLDALNVLIGPNGSGKSNLLEMLAFLPDALHLGLPETFKRRRSAKLIACVDCEFPVDVELQWTFEGNQPLTHGNDLLYHLTVRIDDRGGFEVAHESLVESRPRYDSHSTPYKHIDFAHGRGVATPWSEGRPGGLQRVDAPEILEDLKSARKLALGSLSGATAYPVIEYVKERVLSWAFYNANDMDVRAIKREPAEIDPLQRWLDPSGRNLAMVVYNLTQADEGDAQDAFDRVLRSLYPAHRSLRFPLIDSLHLEPRWSLGHRKPLYFDQVSDGTIRMLCWVAVLANPRPPALVCIDEPELGIHPAWLPILADLIRDAATRTQVIISTHSPELLDEFTPQADRVIVCSQHEDGLARFERLDAEALRDWLDRYSLGKMFRSGHPELGGWPQ